MDDDVDIYGDLPSFDVNECKGCKEKTKELAELRANLAKEKDEEDSKWKTMYEAEKGKIKLVLENTSTLMKTARAEINRKDRIITELRQELENFKFRRKGYRKPEKDHETAGEIGTHGGTKKKKEEMPMEKPRVLPTRDHLETILDKDDEDSEQQWEPGKATSTVYGERLKKKIWIEEQAEKLQKEEAKIVSTAPVSLPKVEENMTAETENIRYGVKLKPDGIRNTSDSNQEIPLIKYEAPLSETGSLHSSEDGDNVVNPKTDKIIDDPGNITSIELIELENRRRKDLYFSNTKFINDSRSNSVRASRQGSNDRSSHESRDHYHNPRDRSRHSEHDRKSRRREESNERREAYRKRSRSNHRSRSKSLKRTRDDKVCEKSRGNKYRENGDRYEKRRDDGLTRGRHNLEEYNRHLHDIRDKLEHRSNDKISINSESNNFKNSDASRKRKSRSRSPGVHSRCGSTGNSRSREIDGRRSRRSRSRGRMLNGCGKEELDRESRKGESKDRKVSSERTIRDAKSKNSASSRRNFTKDPVSSELQKEESNKSILLPRSSAKDATVSELDTKEVECLQIEAKNVETKEELLNEIKVATVETVRNLLDEVEAEEKSIFGLNDEPEILLSSETRLENVEIGSKSFREEKIENIEKFIQDYRYDENCDLLGNRQCEELDNENKCINESTSSIVAVLSMDNEDEDVIRTLKGRINDTKSKNDKIDNKIKDVEINKEPKEDETNQELKHAPIDKKSKDIVTTKGTRNIDIDKKNKDIAIGKKTKDVSIDKKLDDVSTEKKSDDVPTDKKLDDVPTEKKSENIPIEKKSTNSLIEQESENISNENESKNVSIVKKSENEQIDKNPNHVSIENKYEDGLPNKQSEDVIDKKEENVAIVEKFEETIPKISHPLPPSQQFPPLPPLPQSTQLLPLPPLPLTPPPIPALLSSTQDHQTSEIPVVQETSENELDKPLTKKSIAREMKKRPRIPCIPIISRYSRQKRLLVLADSAASHNLVTSESCKLLATIEKGKEEIVIPQTLKVEQKSPKEEINTTNSSKLLEIQSDSAINEPIEGTEKTSVLEDLVKVPDNLAKQRLPQNITKVSVPVCKIGETEIEAASNVVTSTSDKKFQDESPTVPATINDVVPQRAKELLENGVESSKSEVDSKRTGSKSKNPEKISQISKIVSSERETRSALKSIAPVAIESGSSNRKRTLPREKENQSKSAKQPKTLIIAKRRRPVQLHDSSTAMTLVSSIHNGNSELSSKDNILSKR